MDVVTYAFFAYGLTAVISFLTVGLIMIVNALLNRNVNNVNKEMQRHV